jgi:hypothetical protein
MPGWYFQAACIATALACGLLIALRAVSTSVSCAPGLELRLSAPSPFRVAKELRCGQVILASDDELPPAGTHDISAGVVSASELHVHDVEAGFIEAATLYAHELKLK